MKVPELIYCADGNARFMEIAIQCDYTSGARLPATVYYKPEFADQNWETAKRDPAYRARYMAKLAEFRPRLATVQDLESPDQLEDILSWAVEASQHASEAVMIIPKYSGMIPMLPRRLNGKEVRLAFSVPTGHGKTDVDPAEFGAWPVHLLGGSTVNQLKYARQMNVVSADANQPQLWAGKCSVFLNRGARYRPQMSELGYAGMEDAMYLAFRINMINQRAAWMGCPAWIRPALTEHVEMVKRIANQYKDELGFVNRSALLESVKRGGLWVACVGQRVVGFVNYRTRRDGISVVYEIATDRQWTRRGIGAALLSGVPLPRRLKTTAENRRANDFYAGRGMELVGTEPGRKRQLNVWAAI